jgi:hypothetical protein
MKLKLSDWASLAEITSATAVVVTLIVLIVSIRENTDLTRATVYESNINSLMGWRTEIVRDREIAELLGAYESSDIVSLDEIDRTRVTQLVANIFNVYEKAYFAREYDVIGTAEWSRFERIACVHYTRTSAIPSLFRTIEAVMTDEFMSFLEAACAP